MRELEGGLEHRCTFCRHPIVQNSDEEIDRNNIQRAKANDPNALYQEGCICDEEGDHKGAFENWTKAAALGDMMAHYNISMLYEEGKGVERDLKKKIYHLEEAAIGGHPDARFNLGCEEYNAGKIERAMKHWIIAAKLGEDDSLEAVKEGFASGFVSKEDYESTLREQQQRCRCKKKCTEGCSILF
jgi:TPR repeat protein